MELSWDSRSLSHWQYNCTREDQISNAFSLSFETVPAPARRRIRRSTDGTWLGANELSVSHVLKKTKTDERTQAAETRESRNSKSCRVRKLVAFLQCPHVSFQIFFLFPRTSSFLLYLSISLFNGIALVARNSSSTLCVNAF